MSVYYVCICDGVIGVKSDDCRVGEMAGGRSGSVFELRYKK